MNTDRVNKWFMSKVAVADDVVNAHGETSRPDAEILLSCATSALAALMWPGRKKDKHRFVQFLIDFAPSERAIKRISIPVLIAKMKAAGQTANADKLRTQFYPQSRQEILYADRVDQNEVEVLKVTEGLETWRVRESSYAGIIYSDLRSGLVHEYQLAPFMVGFSYSSQTDTPSYFNMPDEPDHVRVKQLATQNALDEDIVRDTLSKSERYINFPYDYLRSVMVGAANQACAFWQNADSFERPEPLPWWIGEPRDTKPE